MTTAVDAAFRWTRGPAGRVLQAGPLLSRAPHLFSTTDLSFRGPAATDDEARLATAMEVAPSDVVYVKQVHGRRVLKVTPGSSGGLAEADAIVSIDPARAIAVRVADCVPILMADSRRRVVAAVHAGWRGTCAGVAGAAVEAIEACGVPPGDLVAALGPSIGPCCYTVDERVRAAFLSATPDAATWFTAADAGKWYLDLWHANVDQLVWTGVPPSAIHVAGLCSKDHPDICFSYRRDGPGAGRIVAAIRFSEDR